MLHFGGNSANGTEGTEGEPARNKRLFVDKNDEIYLIDNFVWGMRSIGGTL